NKVGFSDSDRYITTSDDEDDVHVVIPAHFAISEDTHSIDDSPKLSAEQYEFYISFSYEADDKKWIIADIDYHGWSYESSEEWDGSGKLHGPSEEAVKNAKDGDFESEMEAFLTDYTISSVEAINERDFDIVSDYITKDGPRRDEARDYIDYLDSKDIYETWL